MSILLHPSDQLSAEQIAIIRNHAAAAESEGQLQPEQLELVYKERWFKMLSPGCYTGMEMSLPEQVRLIEAISWADGSMGWAVTLCAGAGWFGGFLDAGLSKRIFAERDVCLAGSGAPNGTAMLDGEGYKISGSWKYASGALHATHLTANCIIHTADARAEVRPFIFDRKDVSIHTAWNYTGMIATGSHCFEVKDLHVPAERCFKIDPAYALVPGALYQYPFQQLAEATLAVNLSGMAIHFIDLCRDIFAQKKRVKDLSPTQQAELDTVLAASIEKINALRPGFHTAMQQSWTDYLGTNPANPARNLQKVSAVSRKLAKTSLQVVGELYPYCGLIAASTGSEINRVWRDIHTASQHALLTFSE